MAHPAEAVALSSLGWKWIRPRPMKPLSKYSDIHSHRRELATEGDTIVNIEPGEPMLPGATYSVGIHPWKTERPISLSDLKRLVATARDPRVVAIGECGFDRLRGGSVDRQSRLFDFHARLAARLGKPLIIHAVKANDLLLGAARRHRPVPGSWIIHGFRGKPLAAKQLIDAGFSLSLGSVYNPDTLSVIPPERLYRETDAE